jgi:hypothetical protein
MNLILSEMIFIRRSHLSHSVNASAHNYQFESQIKSLKSEEDRICKSWQEYLKSLSRFLGT